MVVGNLLDRYSRPPFVVLDFVAGSDGGRTGGGGVGKGGGGGETEDGEGGGGAVDVGGDGAAVAADGHGAAVAFVCKRSGGEEELIRERTNGNLFLVG